MVNFPVYLAQPDKDDYTVTSSIFKSNGQYFVIKNKLGSTQLQMVDLNDVVKISNIGSYDPGLGQVKINSLLVDKDGFVGNNIKISATPSNQSTVTPLRNYIITLDEEVSSVVSKIDTGEIRVTL